MRSDIFNIPSLPHPDCLEFRNLTLLHQENFLVPYIKSGMAPKPYSVSVMYDQVSEVRLHLEEDDIRVSAAINLHDDLENINIARENLKKAIRQGADEVDVRFPSRKFSSGDYIEVSDFIASCAEQSLKHNIRLKMFFDAIQFRDREEMMSAIVMAMENGIHMVGYSTGFNTIPEPEVVDAIIDSVKIELDNLVVGINIDISNCTAEEIETLVLRVQNRIGLNYSRPSLLRLTYDFTNSGIKL